MRTVAFKGGAQGHPVDFEQLLAAFVQRRVSGGRLVNGERNLFSSRHSMESKIDPEPQPNKTLSPKVSP